MPKSIHLCKNMYMSILFPVCRTEAVRTVTSSTRGQLSEKLLDIIPIDRSQVLLPDSHQLRSLLSHTRLVLTAENVRRRWCPSGSP